MKQLFIRFYISVVIVLTLAWYVHGIVLQRYYGAETTRAAEIAHGGGVRLVTEAVDAASAAERNAVLRDLSDQFRCPVQATPIDQLPQDIQRRIGAGDEVLFFKQPEVGQVVAAPLANGAEVAMVGGLPRLTHIEQSLSGGVRLAVAELEQAEDEAQREQVLARLAGRFDYPVEVVPPEEIPPPQLARMLGGVDVVMFGAPIEGSKQYRFYLAKAVSEDSILRLGPLSNIAEVGGRAATTTLAVTLLFAALLIALFLRPVARQLRHVEDAAKLIASGELSARVDERKSRSTLPLAQAFNNMALRTELMVRTQRELLQAVSHELRTPLARMAFAIELLETADDEAERAERIKSLETAAEELDELVGELLSYVRMETAEPQLHSDQIALKETVDSLVQKHSALYPQIQFDVGDDLSQADIVADRAGFHRAIGNLLSNAGRHAKSRVTVSAESTNDAMVVDVDDDGEGIAESDRDRVFEPFVRLDEGPNGRCAGLGLALVKRIVTQHGGHVDVLASPLGGCRIRTTWPASSVN